MQATTKSKVCFLVLFLLLFFQARAELLVPSWQPISPGGGGMFTALHVASNGVVFLGSDVGGVYKSLDGGISWQVSNQGLENYYVQAIASDPQNPSIVYLGTRGGFYKSENGGASWSLKRQGFPPIEKHSFSAPISAIEVDPTNNAVLFAGTGCPRIDTDGKGAVYKSGDYGESWTLLAGSLPADAVVTAIKIVPQQPQRIYLGTNRGFFVSNDGGTNWVQKINGLPNGNVRAVAVDNRNPSTIYITLWSEPGETPWEGGVYKSTDGGENWFPANEGLAKTVGPPGSAIKMTSNYVCLALDPINNQTIYVANNSWTAGGVYKSNNGGESWRNVTNDVERGWVTHMGATTVEVLALNPNTPLHLYYGTPAHILGSKDGGQTWKQLFTYQKADGSWQGSGADDLVIQKIVPSPQNPDVIYMAVWDSGILRSNNGGASWRRITSGIGMVFDLVFSPQNPSVIYAGAGQWADNKGEIVASYNGGESWVVLGNEANGVPDAQPVAIVVDPVPAGEEDTIYAAINGHGVCKSTDSGSTWQLLNVGLPERNIKAMIMDPTAANRLYLGVAAGDGTPGGIYVSEDAGESWRKVDTGPVNVQCLLLHEGNLYAGAREHYDPNTTRLYPGGLYVSRDCGESWQRILETEWVKAVAINPLNGLEIFAGTTDNNYHDLSAGQGIFYSSDGGVSWTQLNYNLPNRAISSLLIDPRSGCLYVGTGGNGAYKAKLFETTPEPIVVETVRVDLHPKMINSKTTGQVEFYFALPAPFWVDVELYNLAGQHAMTVLKPSLKGAGEHRELIDADSFQSLRNGIYLCCVNLRGAGGTERKILKVLVFK